MCQAFFHLTYSPRSIAGPPTARCSTESSAAVKSLQRRGRGQGVPLGARAVVGRPRMKSVLFSVEECHNESDQK